MVKALQVWTGKLKLSAKSLEEDGWGIPKTLCGSTQNKKCVFCCEVVFVLAWEDVKQTDAWPRRKLVNLGQAWNWSIQFHGTDRVMCPSVQWVNGFRSNKA